MNDLERLQLKYDALAKRVRLLEQSVRPLTELRGVDGELLGDQAVVAFLAEQHGMTLATITGHDRRAEHVDARRAIARVLKAKLHWPNARIARNLNRTERGIHGLLS